MPDPAWPSSPPEANYLRLVGAGAGGTATTLASSAAWQALAVSNEVAASVSTANTAVTAVDFEGVGGTSSATAANGLNAALHLLAAWAQEKPLIATSAVSAYQTAVSAMIPAEVSLANRSEQAASVAANPLVLGALTPVIAALDAEYFGEHWPHNAAAGIAYGTALSVLTAALSVPAPTAPPGAMAYAPLAAASTVAQGVGQAAVGEAVSQPVTHATTSVGQAAAVPAQAIGSLGQFSSLAGQPLQAAVSAAEPVMGMFSAPLQTFGSLAALPVSRSGSSVELQELEGFEDFDAPTAGAIGPIPASGLGGIPSAGAAGGIPGAGGAGLGGIPTSGLTSYARPATSFVSENPGKPVGLKPGLLSGSELAGPVTTSATTAVPLLPGSAAPSPPSKGADRDGSGHARVIVGPRQQRQQG